MRGTKEEVTEESIRTPKTAKHGQQGAGWKMEILRKSGNWNAGEPSRRPWNGAGKDRGYLPKGLRLSPKLPHHTPGPHFLIMASKTIRTEKNSEPSL